VAPKRSQRPDFLLGEDKWSLLRSAKVLLNIHRDELPFFEWLRILEAVANGCVVVTEHSLDTKPFEPGETMISGTAESLGLLVHSLLENDELLARVRRDAYDLIRSQLTMRPLAETVAELADELARRPRRRPRGAEHTRRDAGANVAAPLPGAAEQKRRLLAEIEERRAAARENALLDGHDPDAVDVVMRTSAYDGATPRVTVMIPVYDHAAEVGTAIRSVAESAYDEVEVAVLDDGSTDDSAGAARTALLEHPWLPGIVLRHTINRGLGAARNTLVDHARGEYVFALDADNELYPPALERLVAALDDEKDAFFAYSTLEEHEDGIPTSLRSYQPWDPVQLRDGNYIDAMALLRRAQLLELGGYTNDLRLYGWEDYDLWCRAAEHGLRGVHLPEILGRYRRGAASMISITAVDDSEARALLQARYPLVLSSP
jgi:hypothetical protein